MGQGIVIKRRTEKSDDSFDLAGAENGTRTRDPQLGKLMLYQLSYFRVLKNFANVQEKISRRNKKKRLPPILFVCINSLE